VLPKVALTVITVASLMGTWLTMITHAAGTWLQVIPRWLHLLSFAFLAGGYMWKALFSRPAEKRGQQAASVALAAGQNRRFRRLARFVLPLFWAGVLWDAARFGGWGVGWLVWAGLLLGGALTLAIGWDAYARREGDTPFAGRALAGAILALLLLYALVQAAFDVVLAQGGQPVPLLLRWIHLSAFGLWFGGAVWNIFIAVPAARQVVSFQVVIAASQQLERFRVAVRLILPALMLTGLLQAHRYTGLNLAPLTASSFGLLILGKMVLVGVLVGVFLTCPLWRACSPIAGMCNLDDLQQENENLNVQKPIPLGNGGRT
jgi:hypothetical protein